MAAGQSSLSIDSRPPATHSPESSISHSSPQTDTDSGWARPYVPASLHSCAVQSLPRLPPNNSQSPSQTFHPLLPPTARSFPIGKLHALPPAWHPPPDRSRDNRARGSLPRPMRQSPPTRDQRASLAPGSIDRLYAHPLDACEIWS